MKFFAYTGIWRKLKYRFVINSTVLLLISDTILNNFVFNYYVVHFLKELQSKKQEIDPQVELVLSYCSYINVCRFQNNSIPFWIGMILVLMYLNFSYNSENSTVETTQAKDGFCQPFSRSNSEKINLNDGRGTDYKMSNRSVSDVYSFKT